MGRWGWEEGGRTALSSEIQYPSPDVRRDDAISFRSLKPVLVGVLTAISSRQSACAGGHRGSREETDSQTLRPGPVRTPSQASGSIEITAEPAA